MKLAVAKNSAESAGAWYQWPNLPVQGGFGGRSGLSGTTGSPNCNQNFNRY
jgi:hypothetical protein